jgi:Asp-tRNA(Asn)/Glu-tRNA(Gln) amidotransferase A subunit family amidase
VLREPIGQGSEPDTEDFVKVRKAFDRAVQELRTAGAELVDPVVIPDLKALLAQRGGGEGGGEDDFQVYIRRNPNFPFKSSAEFLQSPDFDKVWPGAQLRLRRSAAANRAPTAQPSRGRDPRQTLMTNVLKVMADNRLEALVYSSNEHQPTLISEGMNPPFVSAKGAPQLNTFLIYVPALSVPAGFTEDDLPVGITFQGRPYSDATMIKLAYAYEQATRHRKPPVSVPDLD